MSNYVDLDSEYQRYLKGRRHINVNLWDTRLSSANDNNNRPWCSKCKGQFSQRMVLKDDNHWMCKNCGVIQSVIAKQQENRDKQLLGEAPKPPSGPIIQSVLRKRDRKNRQIGINQNLNDEDLQELRSYGYKI
jgi:hypothetical protein